MSTPIVVVPGSSEIYDRKANVKVYSYYTAIALRWRYIDYFLPQVTAASPHFQLKWITFLRYRNAVHRNFCAGRCSAAMQLNCGRVWTDLNTNAEQPKMANPGEQTTT